MQRNLNTIPRPARLLRWVSLIVAMLALTACGPLGDDDDDPTATAEVIAQPTSSELEISTATPASEDVTSEQRVATPALNASTPVVDGAAVPQATPDQPFTVVAGTPVAGGAPDEGPGTPDVSSSGSDSDSAFAGSDGTSGATPDLGGGDTPVDEPGSGGDPGATPTDDPVLVTDVATPEGGATPTSGDLSDLQPVVVAGCDPGSIPPYTGEQVNFLTNADVNFRTGPGADCDTIGEGPIGTNIPVTVLGGPVVREDDDQFVWVQVEILDQTGWVVLDVLEPAT